MTSPASGDHPASPDDAPFDLAETDRLLSTTRSVRKPPRPRSSGRPAVVLDCIRLAAAGPDGQQRPGLALDGGDRSDKRAEIAGHYTESGAAPTWPQAARRRRRIQTKRVYPSALALTEVLDRVPVLRHPVHRGPTDGVPNAMAAAAYGSIMPAAWSFLLALRSRGLGSVWTTLHLFQEQDVAELLGIPDDVTQVALFPVAHTVGTDFKPATRGPVEDITFVDAWGAHP